ncbi:MAG: ATP-dependent Clp protease ATP-binding subunit ClpX, partial [Lachnospiraceae bacterium]|nr:ATP-dependent Clp protease ATP-binding subunit ClpX [Lachnospiraceae bacterium]
PIIATLKNLDIEALKDILIKPKNALIKQYKKLFYIDNIDLVFEDEAIDMIAKKALDMKLGARGLRSIVEKVMKDIMYETPSIERLEKVLITKGCIEGKEKPIYVLENNNIISLNKKAS